MKKEKIISRIIALCMIIFSFIAFANDYYEDTAAWDTYFKIHLYNPRALIFSFGMSLGIVGFVYGFKQFADTFRAVFSKVGALSNEDIDKHVDFLDFLIKMSHGVGHLSLVIAFLGAVSTVTDEWGWAVNYKFQFIFYILLAYLYILCAIFIIYRPFRKILLNKQENKG